VPISRSFSPKLNFARLQMRELKVSENSFDFGWICAIEETGRYDWHEPVRHAPSMHAISKAQYEKTSGAAAVRLG
jgi:hypothetical protein